MSISFQGTKIQRLQRELKNLEKQRAKAMTDEANALKKINSVQSSLSRTKSQSTTRTKLREIERENKKVQTAKFKQADILKKISKKTDDLNKANTEVTKLRQKEQEKIFKQQEEKLIDYQQQQLSLVESAQSVESRTTQTDDKTKEYDVFISHSADDKDDYVEELVRQLGEAGIDTWYDSKDIPWGGSIRQSIDEGLANSRFGIVILSPTFIKKHWTNYELDGILTKQSSTGEQVILPIWHNVTANDIQKKSYSLANMRALNTALTTTEEIVENVKMLLK